MKNLINEFLNKDTKLECKKDPIEDSIEDNELKGGYQLVMKLDTAEKSISFNYVVSSLQI